VEALEGAQEELRKKAFELAHEHSRLATVLSRSEEDLRRQAEHERRLERERESLDSREKALLERLQAAQAGREDLSGRLQEAVSARAEAESRTELIATEVERASREVAAARESQAAAESRLQVLRGHEASLRSSAHAFLAEREPGKAGRTLAQALSEVPEALVAPLSSALGDLLEGYLDARWEGLSETLAALSSQKAGQATFFLEGAGRRAATPPGKPPAGFEGWLHEAKGVPAGLRDLLPLVALAADGEGARRLSGALGVAAVGWDGVLVHPDGYVRGGSGGTGGASLLQHEREVREAEREAGRAKDLLEEAGRAAEAWRAEQREALEVLASLRAAEEEAREALASAVREHEGLEAEAKRLEGNRNLHEDETLQAREEREAVEAQRAEVVKLLAASEGASAEHDGLIRQGEETLAAARKVQEEAHEKVAQTREAAGRVAQQLKSARNAFRTAGEYHDQLAEQERRLGEETASHEARAASLGAEVTEGQRALGAMLLALQEERTRKAGFEEDQRRFSAEVEGLERQVKEAREALGEVKEEAGRVETALAGVDADLRNLAERMGATFEEAPEELAREFSGMDPLAEEERQEEARALVRLEGRIQELGAVNMLARQEYDELEQRHTFLSGQRKDLEESVASLQETIRKINRTTRDRFMEAFNAVQEHFAHLFKEVFEGGEARLTLLDEANPLETGVEIYAQPPGKKLQNMLALSGGEKAMVALALLFSLFMYRPQPFFLLDEVDAPLDEANINRFSRLLVRFQGQTQFLVVSHNKRTMELAEVLYGVTMAEGGVSKIVSVRLADVEEQLGVGAG
jgi:chromosome segregation protein